VIDQIILRLLDRRGVWMTPVEIFEASPDYPLGDYALADLDTLLANKLVVARRRHGSRLVEYGLPPWVNAPVPAFSLEYFTYLVRRLFRQPAPAA
jgi:hypothetical protein